MSFPSHSRLMARSRMALLFPTLPPSASNASTMTTPHQRHADIVESGGNRSVRLVDCNSDRADRRKGREYGIGHPAGGGFDQAETLSAEGRTRAVDNLVVGNSIHDFVRARCGGEIDFKIEV